MLAIRQDNDVRTNYFRLIDCLTTQIVLDGKGIDPDFSTVYQVNVQKILEEFVDRSTVARYESEIRRLNDTVHRLMHANAALQLLPSGVFPQDGVEIAAPPSTNKNLQRSLMQQKESLRVILHALQNQGMSRSNSNGAAPNTQAAPTIGSLVSEVSIAPILQGPGTVAQGTTSTDSVILTESTSAPAAPSVPSSIPRMYLPKKILPHLSSSASTASSTNASWYVEHSSSTTTTFHAWHDHFRTSRNSTATATATAS